MVTFFIFGNEKKMSEGEIERQKREERQGKGMWDVCGDKITLYFFNSILTHLEWSLPPKPKADCEFSTFGFHTEKWGRLLRKEKRGGVATKRLENDDNRPRIRQVNKS